MGYEVIQRGEETVISGEVQIRVYSGTINVEKPFLLGHLYRVQGGFVPVKTYVFEVTDECRDVDALKKAVDFFFASLLDTEWYVKEIPRSSLLFPIEGKRLFGKVMMEETYGTTGIVRGSGTK
ncbi:hypothetical protein CKK33_01730 [Mucilaginibacter sp. MD40]|uniref:hypothetical protein n=1 Tax=Mucilaginibacter sp. MD40 TaxID=2029590 RepID=UPI000BAC740F|nr:hypothetical protein [Mucilaginibacter sp. MD40]PAW92278.1 hypothetical protein CKK33_01730 [Mucilaginibacter sp. MD40]